MRRFGNRRIDSFPRILLQEHRRILVGTAGARGLPSSAMRIRRRRLHHVHGHGTRGDVQGTRVDVQATGAVARHRHCYVSSKYCRPHLRLIRWWRWKTLLVVMLLVLVGSLPWCLAQPSVVSFDSITLGEWADVFNAASAALQLSQLYLTAPRVRAKIFVAKSVTMAELLSGEAIFRQRISEIVDVAIERVLIEYVETAALQESDRTSWALSLGISALVPPPPTTASSTPNTTLLITTVDTERARILQRLMYGNIIRDANVTIGSLQLFGSPMRLLSAHLDGESFYQIDTTPWVGVSLVFATTSDTTNTPSTVVTNSATTSSSGAFQNLRLRFLLVRFLRRLKIDTSSILVRDAVTLQASEAYGVPALLLPLELHVGDDWPLQVAIDGYLRNTSLTAAFHEIEPQWSLLAVDVASGTDTWRGSGLPWYLTRPGADLPRLVIQLRVDALPLAHVQRRAPAILDTVRALLSGVADIDTDKLKFGRVTMVSDSSVASTNPFSSAVPESGFFLSSGGDDTNGTPSPIDRSYVVRIVLINGINPTSEEQGSITTAVANAVATTPALLALGFLDPPEHESRVFPDSRVRFLGTTRDVASFNETAALYLEDVASSFVYVTLVLAVRDDTTDVVMDAFALYGVRCALLAVLERVLLNDKSLIRLHMTADSGLAVKIVYLAQVEDAIQRRAVQQAVLSRRLKIAIESDDSPFLLRACSVDLHPDGSQPEQIVMPGTANVAIASDSQSTPSTEPPLDPAEVMYSYANPVRGWNPTVRTQSPPSCPSPLDLTPLAPRFYGCLIVRWLTSFPTDPMVFVRSISVTSGVALQSNNVILPVEGSETSNVVYAPWLPAPGNGPQYWSLQILSSSVQNVNLTFELALMDEQARVFPAIDLLLQLSLADMHLSQPILQVVSLQRRNTLVPLSNDTNSGIVVQHVSSLYTSGSRPPISTTFRSSIGITVAEQSSLAFLDPTSSTAAWSAHQPSCPDCVSPVAFYDQREEYTALGQCFQHQIQGSHPLLYEDLLLQPNSTFDVSNVLRSCLSSPTPHEVGWSSKGRAAFTTSLQCLVRSSCAITSSPSRKQILALQYVPREQVIRLEPAHFPLSVSFLLDINGGEGAVPGGVTRTKSSGYLEDASPSVLTALRVLVLELYGEFARGLDVVVKVSDTDAGGLEIRLEYWFLDVGVAGLPYVSVVSDSATEPAPVVETSSGLDSLQLFSTVLAG